MTIKINKTSENVSKLQIEEVQRLLKCEFPRDYVQFLLRNNGGVAESNTFDVPRTKNSSGVNEFLSLEEVVNVKSRMSERFLPSAIPVATAEGGNFVCIVNDKKSGIYFWDHELEQDEGVPAKWDNMFFLADCFSGFLDLLRQFDPDEIELKPGQVIDSWIDPDFLKSLENKEEG